MPMTVPVSLGVMLVTAMLLAFANGANDNFKGVATLFGSRTTTYRTAIWWATAATFAGSVTSLVLAAQLVKAFSGRGIVPASVSADPVFLTSVGLAAAASVLLATWVGMPISTTHALVGALVGAGLAFGGGVVFGHLWSAFFLPLLLSPVIAGLATLILYATVHSTRYAAGIRKELCVCVGTSVVAAAPIPERGIFGVVATLPTLHVLPTQECRERYVGAVIGVVPVHRLVDGLHFLSAGVVSFARGLNDTPKIFGIVYAVSATAGFLGLDPSGSRGLGLGLVSVAMAAGGLLAARRVGKTMSLDITTMNTGQAFTASIVTGTLVVLASLSASPVSTTHVSTGSLFGIRAAHAVGIGASGGDVGLSAIRRILLAWIFTLPTAAILGAALAALATWSR